MHTNFWSNLKRFSLLILWEEYGDRFWNYKQLLDEVFEISRVGKVEVGVVGRSRRLRLTTLTETLIVLDITKTESNYCFIIHRMKQKKSCFCFFTDSNHHKVHELDMITLRNHAPRSYMTWLPMILSVLDMIIVWSAVMTSQTLISEIHCTLSANQKRGSEFNV